LGIAGIGSGGHERQRDTKAQSHFKDFHCCTPSHVRRRESHPPGLKFLYNHPSAAL
jgi:hypothetical protein